MTKFKLNHEQLDYALDLAMKRHDAKDVSFRNKDVAKFMKDYFASVHRNKQSKIGDEEAAVWTQFIKDLTAKAELNKIYNGKVMKIMEFGAFVNFLGKQDGLVHISELAEKRVAKVTDVVKEGDAVKVKVIGFDRGKVKLSIKAAV